MMHSLFFAPFSWRSPNRRAAGLDHHHRYRKFALVTSFLFYFIVCFALNAAGATMPEHISFQDLLENKDIAMGEGSSFLQDSEGFMWIGGGTALFRYDGYEFREMDFAPDESKPNEKESVRYTESIFEDSQRTIWIASRIGLLKYDRNQDELIRIQDMPTPGPKIVGVDVLKIVELSDGTLLAASLGGLFAINRSTLDYELLLPTPVTTIHLDGKDIWIGSESGLKRFDWATKRTTEYSTVSGQEGVSIDRLVRSIVSDGHGKLWIGTAGGLVLFDPANQSWIRYRNDPANPFSIAANDVWKLLVDSHGILWVATDGGGLITFDQETNRFISHKFEPGRIGSLNSNTVRTIYEDRNHDLWVGNYPVGVHFYDRSSSAITTYTNEPNNPRSLSNSSVGAVQEDRDGNLWLGTAGGGLNFFNRKTGEFEHFKSDPNNPNTISGNSVSSVFIDSRGLIWTSCWAKGVASYDPVAKKFTRYPFDAQSITTQSVSRSDRLNSGSVWYFKEDRNQDMWFATHTGGISKLNHETKVFTHYTHNPDEPRSLSSRLVWTMLEDSKSNFWIGTTEGLNLMNREKETFIQYLSAPQDPTTLSHSSVTTLLEDRKGRLWVGTDVGLNLFNADTKTFKRLTKKEGLLNDHIRKILEDADGTIWVSTDNGFSSLNPETLKIKNYNRISGDLVGGFFTKSGIVSRTGEIIFGGAEGLRIINPKAFTENTYVPPVVLTDFKIFSESVAVRGRDALLNNAINASKKIELNYKNTNFSFKYAALNFREADKNLYSYKLEGFDPNWSTPGTQRETKYTNLDPGTYVFRVKASNNDGVWNDEGKSITIVQQTPPWKTWWAYLIYALAALLLLLMGFRRQAKARKFIEEYNRQLEISVAERTAEVSEKSRDMHIILNNIPQGIFTVLGNGIINSEYSKYLEVLFETDSISGRDAGEFLFVGSQFGDGGATSVSASIKSIVGNDANYYASRRSEFPTEYEMDIDGNNKWLSLDWNPIFENGLVNSLMISVRDITQIKAMETNLIQSEKLAALGALVAGVSHELNTPIGNGLTVATSLCDTCETMGAQMKNGLTKAALERFVSDMHEGARIVTRTLTKASELIASFKQVAADQSHVQRRKFSLAELVKDACLTVSLNSKTTLYRVEMNVPQDIELDSYPDSLVQVLTNLLNNALIHAFIDRPQGLITLSTKSLIGGVLVTVEDDGVGIAPEDQPKIFDPFFTTKLGSGGNGLGMHIVHNIVTGVLGGTIRVSSTLGKGTCVTLFVPKFAPSTESSLGNEDD